jgi:hypothetical protein
MLWTAGNRPSRLQDRWSGPFVVKKKCSAVNYIIMTPSRNDPTKTDKVNVNRMKLFTPWENGQPSVSRPAQKTAHELHEGRSEEGGLGCDPSRRHREYTAHLCDRRNLPNRRF